MNRVQQRTCTTVRKYIIDSLEYTVNEADIDLVREACMTLKKVDTGACNVDIFLNDNKVKVALRKMISSAIFQFKLVEEESTR